MLLLSQVAPGKPAIHHCSDVPAELREREHGSGRHTPIEWLSVGQGVGVTFEFTVGSLEVEQGGSLLVVWRWPFDWSDLQTDEPEGDGYVRCEHVPAKGPVPAAVQLDLRYRWQGGIEPWHHMLEAKVASGVLRAGDQVRLICGERFDGTGTWRAPTCAARRSQFLMLIDHSGDGARRRLIDPPSFEIRPTQAVRLVATCASDAVVGEPFQVLVRSEDRWGNVTRPSAASLLEPVGGPASGGAVEVRRMAGQQVDELPERFQVTVREPGEYRFGARSSDGTLEAMTNPLRAEIDDPQLHLFWGDLHSGQTEIGCGAGSLTEHYTFARDCAGLQFITHQANDHYVTRAEWTETRKVTEQFYEPGKFVPFLGCEWSAFTVDGGDRNVFYYEDEPRLRRSDRFFVEQDPDPEPDLRTAPEFLEAFRDQDVLVNIHVGGRPTNLQWHEPAIEKLCEIHSTHGTSQWFVFDALRRGYRVGITAGTDGVMGRPGACHPGRRLIRNVRNGLTAVYAKSLDRASLWEALHQRRCYATTGERIRLWFDVNRVPMGSSLQAAGPCEARVQIEGTGAIERVDLLKGTEVVHSCQVAEPVKSSDGEAVTLRLLWGGTERRGTASQQRVDWDGQLRADRCSLRLLAPVNWQSCTDTLTQEDSGTIYWTSASAGNAAGMVFSVCGDGRVEFESASFRCEFRLGEVCAADVRIDAGGEGRFVVLGPAPREDGPRSWEAVWADLEPAAPGTPYWVRVVQVDQAMAWSSPVYISPRS